MNRTVKLAAVAASLLLGGTLFAFDAVAQSAVGTWTLVSAVTDRGGTKTETFGAGATGMMSLDANGRYMIVITGASLPKFASNNRLTGTAEENKAIVGGSIAHFGTYSINAADKTITFKMESVTFPNWNGSEQKRNLTAFSADELKYDVPAASAGGSATVTWRRAK